MSTLRRSSERTTDPLDSFVDEMRSYGLEPPAFVDVGKIVRMPARDDKPGRESGWCIYYEISDDFQLGGIIGIGVFGSWKGNPEKKYWCSKRRETMSWDEQHRLDEKIKASRTARDLERIKMHGEASLRAVAMWEQSDQAPKQHPYLEAKGIKPHGVHSKWGKLLVPVMDDNQITSLQFIGNNGDKKFLRGGRTKGCYLRIGNRDTDTVYVAEGFATAATLYEITGNSCFVAFNASNLFAVASAVCDLHPVAKIIIAGDDDRATKGNPGRTKASSAAGMLHCGVAFPEFDDNASPEDTDFNDMARLRSLEAVKLVLGWA
jgi:putative DNA primase/helicase